MRGTAAHPALKRAITQLEHTKIELQKQTALDTDGHRKKAVEAITEALAQLNLAVKMDLQ